MGATIARTAIGFDVFEGGSLIFKEWQPVEVRLHVIWLFSMLGALTGWSFLLATIGAVGNLFLLRQHTKQHGWIMMAAIMFLLMLPVQMYLSWQDFHLWRLFDPYTGMPLAKTDEIFSVFLMRYTNVLINVATGMLVLMGVTLVMVLAARPLSKCENVEI